MKIKNKLRKFSVFATLLAVSTLGIVAYAKTDLSLTNTFQTGGVDISISQSENDNITITPNMHLSQSKEISNYGAECYIRAKVDCEDKNLIENINVSKDWSLYPDGYYYYKNILQPKKTVNFYNGIDITSDFSNEMIGKQVKFEVTAEAIQSANFTPDWNSSSAWGTVEIKKLNNDNNSTVSQATQIKPLIITYDNESQKLISNSENFFENIGMLMAGDIYTDTLTIENKSNRDINLSFTQTVKSSELSEKTSLKIVSGDDTLYNSNSMKNMNTSINIPANSNSQLTFTVSISTDTDNEFAFKSNMVEWLFSVSDGNSDDTLKFNNNMTFDIVSSGDNRPVFALLLTLCSSLIVIIFIRKGQKNENSK